MTSVVQQTTQRTDIPPHVLLVGKKSALDYIAPALFRIGTFGELVIKAKGSLSIVTAVNVAEMVKHDVAGLETQSIAVGTDEFILEGAARRVSFIDIHLTKKKPEPAKPHANTPTPESQPALAAPKKRASRKKTATRKRTVRKKVNL